MNLSPELLKHINEKVREGFQAKEDLMVAFCEEMYEPGELDEDEVSAAIDAAFERLAAEQLSWPVVTDCDRLDQVFANLNSRGVVALQNAGYTQSDGISDCAEVYQSAPDQSAILGYCFYQGQDLERAVQGRGLFLAFGPIDPADNDTKGLEVGRIVCEELQKAGFEAEWGGTMKTRISVPKITWQRWSGSKSA
jgi:hypothetical protein